MAKLIPYVLLGAFAAVVVLTILFWGGQHGGRFVGRWNRKRRARRDREVPWTPYCRPDRPHGKPVVWQIGVQRRTEDGRVLADVHMRDVELGDDLEREAAMFGARLRAREYNEAKVGM